MTKIIQRFYLLLVALITITSCKKDEIKSVIDTSTVDVKLTASATSLTLIKEDSTKTALSLSWNEANFNYKADVTYTLQIAKTGTSFYNPAEITVGVNTTSYDLNTYSLNSILYQNFGISGNGSFDIRVKISLLQNGTNAGSTSSIDDLYSDTLTIPVNTFDMEVSYPKLWITGPFNNWSFTDQAFIASQNFDGNYAGFLYVPSAVTDYTFKLSDAQDWDHTQYGYATNTTMSSNASAGNLWYSGAGYVYITANTNNLTWSATVTNWYVVGDAIDGTWTTFIPMTYDPTTSTWITTTTLKNSGSLKFLANQAWNIFLGLSSSNQLGIGEQGNISVPNAGTYKITLDLHNAPNYTYTIEKQ
ncbi:SusE domain-containing protein [Rhizosphaericola mali]|uniref:Uncharacterized protein n=1 Tax=Rhizosphaericola mali TaxID=2545455 RepID=A0A5P2G7A7_9BACT|nr:SusE domain-containing protein [Rhizosphaericola mali]QES89103.1 hypothetical protein E0W69_010675 [Rhizosphaericola mali]